MVILDRNMPGMGGIETLQALRLVTRERERVPVIMLSADATPEARQESLEADADAFLSKPIEAVRLLEEIRHLAESAEQARRPEPASVARALRPAPSLAPRVVNTETLGHLEELGSTATFVEKLVRVFLADSSTLLVRIERAIADRDFHEVRSLLHAMKGSSASMGTDRLTGLCGSLGRQSDAEFRLHALNLQRSLADELAAARGELERYLRERQQSAG